MKVSESRLVTYDLTSLSEEEARALVVALAFVVSKGTTTSYSASTVMGCKAMLDELREFIN